VITITKTLSTTTIKTTTTTTTTTPTTTTTTTTTTKTTTTTNTVACEAGNCTAFYIRYNYRLKTDPSENCRPSSSALIGQA
jgi:hypothetical protein